MKNTFFQGLRAGVITFTLSFFALSCQKNSAQPNAGTGAHTSLHIFLTDDPALSLDHVFIDVQKLEVKVEDSLESDQESHDEQGSDSRDKSGDSSGGWMTLDIHPGIYDILQFRNGLDTLFASGVFPSVRSLKKIRLTLGTNNSVVFNGTPFPLVIKGNDNIVVIKLVDDVQAGDPGQLGLSLDFDAGRSVTRHGNEFDLQPQIRMFSKEKAAGIEGTVLPAQAQPVVMAINGTDTATAKPGSEGEYKIVGLHPGTYSLIFHATAGNYQDTTINNIVVGGNEDIHAGTVTLHP
jgi:Domain of unknown function (DUF4382)